MKSSADDTDTCKVLSYILFIRINMEPGVSEVMITRWNMVYISENVPFNIVKALCTEILEMCPSTDNQLIHIKLIFVW